LRLASFLIPVTIGSTALLAGPLCATGLYPDPVSFFSRPDSARVLAISQTECDLGAWRASLLTGALTIRPAPRFEVRLDLQLPAVRRRGEIVYGVGDMLLRAIARIAGDSLNTSGLFLRADVRIPSGSQGLRPFSDGAFEGEAGLEARLVEREFAVRGAALYTLAGDRRDAEDFTNDSHLTLAASISVPVPGIASAGASAFFMRFDNGDTRSIFLVSLRRPLSEQLALELAGAIEAGDESARAFDSCVSVSFAYRLPVPQPAPRADSSQP
jgi:hypothetical protein